MTSNEIFESNTIKEKVDEQIKAIRLLALQGYTILDFEGNVINKWNINEEKRNNISYHRVPKLKT